MREGTKRKKCKRCNHIQKVSEYEDRPFWICCKCNKRHDI